MTDTRDSIVIGFRETDKGLGAYVLDAPHLNVTITNDLTNKYEQAHLELAKLVYEHQKTNQILNTCTTVSKICVPKPTQPWVDTIGVVYTAIHGGYGLSDECKKMCLERIGTTCPERDNQLFVEIVNKLGPKASSDRFAYIQTVNVPAYLPWYITEYDGIEDVYPLTMN